MCVPTETVCATTKAKMSLGTQPESTEVRQRCAFSTSRPQRLRTSDRRQATAVKQVVTASDLYR